MRDVYDVTVKSDTDEVYAVNNKTVTPPDGEYTDIAVQGDNNSNRLYFKVNRVIDGVDISEKTVGIYYENADGYSDLVVMNTEYDTDYVYFEWLLGTEVTYSAGEVRYIIRISDSHGYVWKSKTNTFTVLETLDVNIDPPTYAKAWSEMIEGEIEKLKEGGGGEGGGGSGSLNALSGRVDTLETKVAALEAAAAQRVQTFGVKGELLMFGKVRNIIAGEATEVVV